MMNVLINGYLGKMGQAVVKAINDPRYKEDAAYRKDVENKIKRSEIIL